MSLAHVSDTARWMAFARSIESKRPDALFHDPYSQELAGDLGESLAREIGSVDLVTHGIAIRTAMLDRLVQEMVVKHQVDLVLNLGAGLDTRPWRLRLPEHLWWLDVDLRELLIHKARILATRRASCHYQQFPADILQSSHRAAILEACGEARRILVVTEGLLVYMHPAQVEALAKDLHGRVACRWWLTDLVGPRALQRLQQVWAPKLRAVEFHFGPPDSAQYFGDLGWREDAFYSSNEEARRVKRAPKQGGLAWLFSKLASSGFREEIRRLAGVAVLAREEV